MGTPSPPLIVSTGELGAYLRSPVDEGSAEMAIRVASGLLMGATHFTVWPIPVPEPLWSWAIELSAIAYENPVAMTESQVGDERTVFFMQRRREIIDAARQQYPSGGVPLFEFPPAEPWPL